MTAALTSVFKTPVLSKQYDAGMNARLKRYILVAVVRALIVLYLLKRIESMWPIR